MPNKVPLSASDSITNEKGVADMADALFGYEYGWYTVTLIATVHWHTPKGVARKQSRLASFREESPETLAATMQASGWEPPANLRALCEAKLSPPDRRRVKAARALSSASDRGAR